MNTFKLKLPFELNTVSTGTKQSPVIRSEGAQWHQFIWVKEGVGTFRIRDEEFTLGVGRGIFMRRDVPCSYDGENLHTAWCAFFSTDHLIEYTVGEREYVLFDVPDFLDGATEELRRIARADTTTLALSAAGYSYVTELFAAITNDRVGIDGRVRDFLFRHYSEPLTLDEVAAAVELDRFSLCRLFRERTGTTVMRELTSIRISKAKRMLRYTQEPIENVGRLCGFESHSYFTKRFGEYCGATPKEYRAKYMGI